MIFFSLLLLLLLLTTALHPLFMLNVEFKVSHLVLETHRRLIRKKSGWVGGFK